MPGKLQFVVFRASLNMQGHVNKCRTPANEIHLDKNPKNKLHCTLPKAQISKKETHEIVNIFLLFRLNMCFVCSKEPSQRDGSFEYPQHMFWLRNKKNNFQLRALIWGSGPFYIPLPTDLQDVYISIPPIKCFQNHIRSVSNRIFIDLILRKSIVTINPSNNHKVTLKTLSAPNIANNL